MDKPGSSLYAASSPSTRSSPSQPAPQDQTARGGVPEPTHPPAPQHGQLPCAGSPVAQATSQDEEVGMRREYGGRKIPTSMDCGGIGHQGKLGDDSRIAVLLV